MLLKKGYSIIFFYFLGKNDFDRLVFKGVILIDVFFL